MTKKATILGAGPAGSTIAYLLGQDGWDCTVIDGASHPGGGIWTHFHGGHPYTKGPRPYYGWSKKIYEWMKGFVPMRNMPLECYSYVASENKFFSFPIHEDDIPTISNYSQIKKELENRDLNAKVSNLEEYWIAQIGTSLYDMFVKDYTKKMWFLESNTEFDQYHWSVKTNPFKTGGRTVEIDCSGYPLALDGYNNYFKVALEKARVILNEQISQPDLENKVVTLSTGEKIESDILISTIALDDLMGEKHGTLRYTSRKYVPFVLPIEQVFPGNMHFAYYTQDEPCTRIVEYKKITQHKSDNTLLVMELPTQDPNYKLYPYPMTKYQEVAKEYTKHLPKDVYSIGRLGTYKYTSQETTLVQAFQLYKDITGKSYQGMENEYFHPNSGGTDNLDKKDKEAKSEKPAA